jgi:hypothetical protein
MSTSQSTFEKPGMFTALSIMTLVSGVLNIIYGLTITALIVVGTLGFGLLCAPITILPGILGIFEILYAVKLLSNPQQPIQFSQAIAIMEICCIITGNVISTVAGILALVFYNDPAVKAYFVQINSGTASPISPLTPPLPTQESQSILPSESDSIITEEVSKESTIAEQAKGND